MPVDNLSGGTLSIFNVETNQKLCDLDNVKDVSIDREGTWDYSDINRGVIYYYRPIEIMDLIVDDHVNAFIRTLTSDPTQFPELYDIQFEELVQARTHKKKRINKKWLNRYGYKKKIVTSEDWKLTIYDDGTIGFMKDGGY